MTTANPTVAVWCECPVLNHKYIVHKYIDATYNSCILLVTLRNKVASDWLTLGTRNPYIQV